MVLNPQHIEQLFQLVKQTIQNGVEQAETKLSQGGLQEQKPFSEPAATFVTLHIEEALRGCIGTLEAYRSLHDDVIANAYSAAFRDPRFYPVSSQELDALNLEISILTQPELMPPCETKSALIEQLTPHKDGLIISDGVRRATFLPSVWQQLQDKEQFVDHLMRKAGMVRWSESMQCHRYFVDSYAADWQQVELIS